MRNPIEIFRSGRHTAMSGEAVSFSDSDLDVIASSYDPAVHEAPIVIGHPADNAPAFGWVAGLSRNGGSLEATPNQVDPAFAEAVKAGRYKKISASFYKPDSPSNPKPGQYYLRHVGFLGAMPPSVKGLRGVSFAGSAEDCLVIDFADETDDVAAIEEAMGTGTVLGRLRAVLIRMWGQATADEALPLEAVGGAVADAGAGADAGAANLAEADPAKLTDDVLKLLGDLVPADKVDETKKGIEELVTKALAASAPAVDDKKTPPPPADAGAANLAEGRELTPREKALADRELAVQKREREQRREQHESFLEGLLREGRPTPVKREAVIGLLTALDAVPKDAGVSFGEGEQRAPVAIFRELLSRLPKQIDFDELAGGSFVESDDPQVVAKAAQEYQATQLAKGVHISTTDAVNHVKGHR